MGREEKPVARRKKILKERVIRNTFYIYVIVSDELQGSYYHHRPLCVHNVHIGIMYK